MNLILASQSPRRREILALLGLPFEVMAPEFEERVSPHLFIGDEVLQFALGKADSVARTRPASIVVGSDTMILLDGQKIGKPADQDEARRTLGMLSGRTHLIFTGVAIVDNSGGPGLRTVETVEVDMRRFERDEIERYLSLGESHDKAAGYSIQGEGRRLIEAIRGDYLAAVGMPLRPIARYLEGRGVRLERDIETLYREKSFLNWGSFE
ncbi:MAG TPA: Maf family protein [Candidatus Binatia bacterium]|nr:Maf family protein [Candidatus Binatia bacterium]